MTSGPGGVNDCGGLKTLPDPVSSPFTEPGHIRARLDTLVALCRTCFHPLEYTVTLVGDRKVDMEEKPFSSVDNALHVLLLFKTRRTLRVADVADELDVARSTAHRLLTALVERGFASQDPVTRAYLAGPVLTEIGMASLSMLGFRDQARPVMNKLAQALRETVSLIVLEGANARFLDSIESSFTVRVGSRSGQLLPAHCVSGGKALLAELPDEQIMSLYTTERLVTITPNSINSRTALLAELEDIRARGFSTNIAESETDVTAAAVALNMAGVKAAVTVAAPTSRLTLSGANELGNEILRIVAGEEAVAAAAPARR